MEKPSKYAEFLEHKAQRKAEQAERTDCRKLPSWRSIWVPAAWVLAECLLLFAMRWFALGQFQAWGNRFWRALSLDTLIWEHVISYEELVVVTGYLFSFLLGGLLVFLIIKPVEKLIAQSRGRHARWFVLAPVMLAAILCLSLTIAARPAANFAGWTARNVEVWLSPALSYLGGLCLWSLSRIGITMQP